MYLMVGLTYTGEFSGLYCFLSYYDFITSHVEFPHYILYELDINSGTIKRVKEK